MKPIKELAGAQSKGAQPDGGAQPGVSLDAPPLNVGSAAGTVPESNETHAAFAAPGAADLIYPNVLRNESIKQRGVIYKSLVSKARRRLGWALEKPPEERKEIEELAIKLVKSAVAGKAPPNCGGVKIDDVYMRIQSIWARPLTQLQEEREALEAQMVSIAEKLPGYDWAMSFKGLGSVQFAVIIAEVGDLSGYANPGKLWKRFGVAPYRGHLPSWWVMNANKPGCKLTAQEWEELGYCPRRRSVLYVATEGIIKAKGPFFDLYLRRKEGICQKHPEYRKGVSAKTGRISTFIQCDKQARVYVGKRLLCNLWRAWNGNPPESPAEAVDVRNAG